MGETFYSVLGIEGDADTETIRRAYRERVKEHHPDVNDDPDAPEQFRRLTTARDVLLDADERRQYDRLGHGEYVSKHVDSTAWHESTTSDATPTETASERATKTQGTETSYDRTAWLGEDAPGSQHTQQRQHRQQSHTVGPTATAKEWQRASQTYKRADTGGGDTHSSVWQLVDAVRSVGPWLLVHVIFVGSAAATTWLAFSQLSRHVALSWPPLLVGVGLIAMTVFVSVLHVISQIYT